MWRLIAIGAVMFVVGSCSWKVGEQLSSDSVAMMLGLLFGVLGGLPVALLAMHNNLMIERERTKRQRELLLYGEPGPRERGMSGEQMPQRTRYQPPMIEARWEVRPYDEE